MRMRGMLFVKEGTCWVSLREGEEESDADQP